MNVASLARGARQSLARGLEALQARDAPPALIDVAQAVARAIGLLVDLELASDTPDGESVEVALDALRDGLRLLQAPEHASHPAAARGMKAVAEAIGIVLPLARSLRQRPPSPPVVSMRPGVRAVATIASAGEESAMMRAVNAVMGPAPPQVRVEAPSARLEPAPPCAEPLPLCPEPLPTKLEPRSAPEPGSIRPEPLAISHEPARVPREAAPSHPEPPRRTAPPSLRVTDARPPLSSRPPVSIRRDVVVERDLRAVDAPLGAHSASNFYSGLSGGDVVASGGLFVATYQVPKVGEKVLLKISMPGGYEFVAKAKVAWTRDVATSLNPGSPRGVAGAPGFGAQFCEITEEGRRLIQRYVRNREPLFHEDAP